MCLDIVVSAPLLDTARGQSLALELRKLWDWQLNTLGNLVCAGSCPNPQASGSHACLDVWLIKKQQPHHLLRISALHQRQRCFLILSETRSACPPVSDAILFFSQ